MRRNLARMLAILVLCFGLLGCPRSKVEVAVVLPLTGPDQTYGEAIRRGVELAYEELVGDSVNILVEPVDSESKPELAKELLEDKFGGGAIAAIGGATSDEAKAMLEVIDRTDRVLLSPSASSPDLTGISRNFYRIFPSDFNAATKMADFAARSLKAETVVVIAEERDYARGIQSVFQPAFEKNGGEVLEVIEVPPNTADFSGLADRVMTLKPDAVYLAAYEGAICGMVQELRRLEFSGRILTTSAFSTFAAITRVGEDAAGVMFTQTYFDPDSEHAHVRRFVKAYQDRYGDDPDIFAAHGYDAMKVMAAAVEGRPAMPTEVHKGMRDIREFPGVTGSIQFDEKGDVPRYPRVYVIGDDLELYDYNDRVQKQKEELRRRREELRRRLEEIQREAAAMDG